jgi:Holliday junction resolvase RusA-like endonuclease
MLDVRFTVEGTPLSKGSMSGFPIARGRCAECLQKKRCGKRNCFGGTIVGVSVTDQGDQALKAWQQLIQIRAISARNAAGQRMVQPPHAVAVSLAFVMPRPAGHWTDRGSLTSAGRERSQPTVKPDCDKLMRACLDALTEALVRDDAMVTVARVAMVYANWKGWTGVSVEARQFSIVDDWVERQLVGVWAPENHAQGELL